MRRKLLLLAIALLALALTKPAHAATPREEKQMAVEYVLTRQVMFPQADGAFHPGGFVSRLEFTLAVVDTFYREEDFEGCFRNIASSLPVRFHLLFSDVDRESWFGKRLCVAMHAGLIGGDRDGAFRPFATITTAEASKIMARAYGIVYPSLSVQRQPWYRAPMLALSMRGAISGGARPESFVTRQGMATMFFALRNQERYPQSRIIGQTTPTPVVTVATASLQVDTAQTAATSLMTPMTVQVSAMIVTEQEASDPEGPSMTTFSRPSSRLLREQARAWTFTPRST